ncbi:MAG TPA: hypothetical protein VMU25_03485 [Candidatus Paceibacterota bacterium]|nr:hypothetical protein [Candidatus Paceibacterota bacterium]
MSTKTVVWIIILILVVLGVWYFWSQSQTAASPSSVTPTTTQTTTQTSQVPAQTSGTQAAAPDNSDQSLNNDLTQIDAQTSAANQSSASVDQSFNDQSVQQSQL